MYKVINPIIAILLYTALIFLNVEHVNYLEQNKDKYIYIPPPKDIQFMTFGFNDIVSDSLWLRWIQSPEECGKGRIPRSLFEHNFEGFKQENEGLVKLHEVWDRNKKDVCAKGWSFQMLDAITELSPKFRSPYLAGPILLSVIVDDHEGAEIIFKKAIASFPEDWKFHYQLAYHYLYELDDYRNAAHHLIEAANKGAPQWTRSLASRLYTKTGQALLGLMTLKKYRLHVKDEDQLEKVNKRIADLERLLEAEQKK